jgi:hypothetical protein
MYNNNYGLGLQGGTAPGYKLPRAAAKGRRFRRKFTKSSSRGGGLIVKEGQERWHARYKTGFRTGLI